jgi:RHS repeat-associated protein
MTRPGFILRGIGATASPAIDTVRTVRPSRLLCALLTGLLAVGLPFVPSPAARAAEPVKPLPAQEYAPVPHAKPAKSTARAVADPVARAERIRRPAPAWPAAGTADVTVPAKGTARVGRLPILIAGAKDGAAARAKVSTLDRAAAARAGVDGLLLRVSAPDATATAPADLQVTVEYGRFAAAYGADWASRLRLVALPDCAPGAACTPVALPTSNDVKSQTVTARVSEVTAVGTLVAATSGPSGGAGDFTATDLGPSDTWSQSGSGGDFTWSYPLEATAPASGPQPGVTVSYSSQSVDGRSAASNNQPGSIGEGFRISSQSYIERRYKTCSGDMGGTGANNTVKTGDRCWGPDNAVLTMSGHSGELIKGSDGLWHLGNEDGAKIERLTSSAFGNGDDDGEYWKVTTPDGTQYWFGRHQLPGWSAGKPVTNSVWTAPVYGNNTGEPCHQGTFAASACTQAWRWNLDYVVDVDGDTMSYWYTKETNKYAKNLAATNPVDYVRGGFLTRIDYGTDNRDGTEYTATAPYTNAPQQVVFTNSDRCLSSCTTKNATNWPDTPWDLDCTVAPNLTNCLQGAPTFWTGKRITKVTTMVSGNPVDAWAFDQSFPDPGDGTRAGLWLKSITYSGLDGDDVTYPSISFSGIQMQNRVDAAGGDWALAMNWWRVNDIRNETGGETFVTYSPRECVAGSKVPAAADDNSLRCYPVKWTPPGRTSDVLDYYHKYVVTDVQQIDHAGGSKKQYSHYDYQNPDGLPLWHKDDEDGLSPAAKKSWADWRGYPTVITTLGAAGEQTKTETLYYRGMDGDLRADGTKRSVNVVAREGDAAVDREAFAGQPREEITWNGSAIVDATVTDRWQSAPTATRTVGDSVVESRYTGENVVRDRTALDGGAWRRTKTVNTFDQYGMKTQVADLGDEATTTDDQCAVTEYARNTVAPNWLLTPVRRTHSWAGACDTEATAAAQIIADTRYVLDDGGDTSVPTKGRVTATKTIAGFSGGTRTYHTDSTAKYDSQGRVTDQTDVTGANTHTDYTPASGGPVTKTVETNALQWTTTKEFRVGRHLPTKVTDTNGRSTEIVYDGAGRTTSVWSPGRPSATYPDAPSSHYEYDLVKADGITLTEASRVTTTTVDANGRYKVSHAFYDGFVRARQTQSVAYGGPTPSRKIVTDTFYDSAGRVWKTNAEHSMSGVTTGKLSEGLSLDVDIPRQTVNTYDGAGRVIDVAQLTRNGVVKWRTTTSYHGDHVDVTPPAGDTPTSTWTDARDRTVALREFHGTTPTGTYDETRSGYAPAGKLASVTDASGNTWSYTYDVRGRQVSAVDPDRGTTGTAYNAKDQTESVTDAEGRTIAYTYDALGRKLTLRDGTVNGNVRADWTYDSPVKGLTDTSTRYVVGTDGTRSAYSTKLVNVDAEYRTKQSRISIPPVEGVLAGTYNTSYTYKADGSPATVTLPAAGGLAQETLTYDYDGTYATAVGLKTNYAGAAYYVNQATYTDLFEPSSIARSTQLQGAGFVSSSRHYDDSTGRVDKRSVMRSVGTAYLADTRIDYDAAGNVRSLDDNVAAGRDTQCFRYDHLRRLTEAWTPSSSDCAALPASASALGGPAPYWQSWSFGAPTDPIGRVGNRLRQVDHGATGDVTTSYAYPAAGQERPHGSTATTRTGAAGTTTATYGYDDAGNLISRPGAGGQQSLGWDAEGKLATLTDSTGTAGYLYDADGGRLVSRDSTGTTIELGTAQLRLPKGATTATAIRYYSFGGETIAQRDPSKLCWLASDGQGTSLLAVTADGQQTLTQRRQNPYGESRGTQVPWVNPRGFLGGQADPTGLTHLGAREYDPGLGKFVSVDPLQDLTSPQQWNAYAYANNTPMTMSDSSGTRPECGNGSGGDTCDNSAPRAHRKPGDPPSWQDDHSKARARQHQRDTNRHPGATPPRRVAPAPPPLPRPKPPGPGWQDRTGDVVRFTLNAPSTAIGWGYGESTGADCGWYKHLMVTCSSGGWGARDGGMTIGNVLTTTESRKDLDAQPEYMEHETRHATQYAWFFPFQPVGFLASYTAASGVSWGIYKARGAPVDDAGDSCNDPAICYNVFERDADLHKGRYFEH